jgi:hypothetical protein
MKDCTHTLPDRGRFEVDVCHACGADVGECSSAEVCTLCDSRLAVVGAHRLGDVALHVTLTRPWNEDARCLECVLDDLTRLVIAEPESTSATN